MNKTKIEVPKEDEEQTCLIQWVNGNKSAHPELKMLFHIPNEGKRSFQNGAMLKGIGLKKGVPDLILPVAKGCYHGLFIELKRTKKSKTSSEQKLWLEALNRYGYKAVICYGWVEAAETICRYLGIQFRIV